jgi:UDP-2,4-diacetamido-2,4,6-trideoxy-beta-L-altropyranose hydrolase
VVLAEAGEAAGLGHLSRSAAVAVALEARGVGVQCLAHGAAAPVRHGQVEWTPVRVLDELSPSAPDVLVVDSYVIDAGEAAERVRPGALVVFDDGERAVPEGATPVRGLELACLGPVYWGLPPARIEPEVRRVVVTVGGGSPGLGAELAAAAAEAVPGAEVGLVGREIPPQDALLDELVAADLVVCAGGQTMLEAVAVGTPCVALVVADNQRGQAQALAEREAVWVIDPPDPGAAGTAVGRLAADLELRSGMSQAGQGAIDGFGALRVAFGIARQAASRPSSRPR